MTSSSARAGLLAFSKTCKCFEGVSGGHLEGSRGRAVDASAMRLQAA